MTTPAFRPDRPTPGSPWARHCPEAWPREWLVNGKMPPEFTRPATQDEADLITGRISEARFLYYTGKRSNPSPLPASTAHNAAPSSNAPTRQSKRQRRRGRSERNALVERVRGYRQFFEAVATLDPPLSPGAVTVWCWLWTCTRKGQAKYTVRRLAERFGVVPSTVSRWVGELTNAGFVETMRRGKPGRSATIVRIRYSPNTKPDGQP